MSMLMEIKDLVIAGRAKIVTAKVQEALDAGEQPEALLNCMIDAMSEIGEKFTKNEIFVPEMLVAARAMQKGVAVLKPHMASDAIGSRGKMIIGTVQGDLHDIGKNLVAMMVEGAGFEVIDLGSDVPPQKFVDACIENPGTKIVGMSALLTTTMPSMEATVNLLNEQAFRKDIKIMIGGAPITQTFADKIGADAYTEDAATAAVWAKNNA